MHHRHLVIVDLEATCWKQGEHRPDDMEIIEIGAVLVDPARPEDAREFQTFVRPVRFPELSEFCRNMTTIQQQDVETADPFPIAFPRFLEWIGDPAAARLASWGAYDRKQFVKDCLLHGIPYPFAEDHFNIKQFFGKRFGGRPPGMGAALRRLGLDLEGTHHRGIDDARNIFRILLTLTGDDLTGVV